MLLPWLFGVVVQMKLNHCYIGDCRDSMRQMLEQGGGGKVQTIVTSPPYWWLRDYKVPPTHWPEISFAPIAGLPPITVPAWDGCLGLEPDPWMFVGHIVEVFRLARALLADDGTLWLNFGDSYAGGGNGGGGSYAADRANWRIVPPRSGQCQAVNGLKAKDLCGIPWRVAFALQADGWYLRQDNIWAKPNPMPESVRDRCTKAHEYMFLLAKSERYYFDQDAILEPCSATTHARLSQNVQDQIGSERAHGGAKTNGNMKAVARKPGNINPPKGQLAYEGGDEMHRTKGGLLAYAERQRDVGIGSNARPRKAAPNGSGIKNNESFDAAMAIMPERRNKRSVWTIATEAYSEAHYATFPKALIEPCILAGSKPGQIVFDPFFGSGTSGEVAQALGRNWVGCDLNPENLPLQEKRTRQRGLEFVA